MMNKFSWLHKRDSRKERDQLSSRNQERKQLIEKVEKGTDFAIREYRDVFRKLAELDKK